MTWAKSFVWLNKFLTGLTENISWCFVHYTIIPPYSNTNATLQHTLVKLFQSAAKLKCTNILPAAHVPQLSGLDSLPVSAREISQRNMITNDKNRGRNIWLVLTIHSQLSTNIFIWIIFIWIIIWTNLNLPYLTMLPHKR